MFAGDETAGVGSFRRRSSSSVKNPAIASPSSGSSVPNDPQNDVGQQPGSVTVSNGNPPAGNGMFGLCGNLGAQHAVIGQMCKAKPVFDLAGGKRAGIKRLAHGREARNQPIASADMPCGLVGLNRGVKHRRIDCANRPVYIDIGPRNLVDHRGDAMCRKASDQMVNAEIASPRIMRPAALPLRSGGG